MRDHGAFSVITNLQMDLLFEALIQVRTSYLPHEILWGYQFRHNCVQFDSEEQKYEVSFDSFNDIVKDDTPRFSPKVFYTSKKGKS